MPKLSQDQIDLILNGIAKVEELMDRIIYQELLKMMRQLARNGYLEEIFDLLETHQLDLPIVDAFLMALAPEFKGGLTVADPYYDRLNTSLPQYSDYWSVLYFQCKHMEFKRQKEEERTTEFQDPKEPGARDC